MGWGWMGLRARRVVSAGGGGVGVSTVDDTCTAWACMGGGGRTLSAALPLSGTASACCALCELSLCCGVQVTTALTLEGPRPC